MADVDSATSATYDFQRARRRAGLRSVLAQLRGGDPRLLSYEDVRRRLKAVESAESTLEDVPLDAIVGSLGRYQDFTREFLPLVDEDRGRWVGVKLAMTGLAGVPPVELYRIGDAYFVKDGNHRVSVARELGARTIHAYVTPVRSRVPLEPDVDYEALILASEYAAFLEETGIDVLRPDADLRLTEAGQYPRLSEHIRVHQYFMGIDSGGPVAWEEAVAHWYDAVYLPVARAIGQYELLARFSGRTETDLYLFLSEHRGRLEREFGWSLTGPQLAEGLSADAPFDVEARADQLRRAVDSGRPVREAMAGLVDAVLVVADSGGNETVLAHGLAVARQESATLLGLRLGAPASPAEGEAAKERFAKLCAAAGVSGQLAYAAGNKVGAVLARSDYVDLVVVGVPLPGGAGVGAGIGTGAGTEVAQGGRADRGGPLRRTLARRQSWLRSLMHRSRKPLLVVRTPELACRRPLLAYDGGARAKAALFWLAYLCLTRGLQPTVVTVAEPVRTGFEALDEAGAYLARLGLEARLIRERGAVEPAILRTAADLGSDLVLLGSYKYNRWLEEVAGGVIDRVVAEGSAAVLIT